MLVSPANFDLALEQSLRCCDQIPPSATISSTNSSIPDLDVVGVARDLGTLLHSHCTKLSLAARPPKTEEAVNASMVEIHKLLPQFGALCKALWPDTHGAIVCATIRSQSRYALLGLKSMVEAVREDPVSDSRLSKTGILWDACLELQKINKASILMSKKIRESIQMIDDAVQDLQSWSRGDLDGNSDGFEDSGSESDAGGIVNTDPLTMDTELARRITILKRTELLLKAIDKRRISQTSSIEFMNTIYNNITELVVEVDDLAGEIQEAADPAFIMEMEKDVVHRVETICDVTSFGCKDSKWREWISNFQRKWLEDTNMLGKPRVRTYMQPPSYETFFECHLKPLVPCVIRGLIDAWPSWADWHHDGPEGNRIPNYDTLRKSFGSTTVAVSTSTTSAPVQMTFSAFLTGIAAGERWYAKDMHFQRLFPKNKFYTCPPLLRDDWLNFQLDHEARDDYKFVYFGADGTETLLHKDVVASHSWSTNLTGSKEWTLIPPCMTADLFSFDGDEIASNINLQDPLARARWPQLEAARKAAVTIIQRPGETVFVPSTWYHQVRNIGPTLSINHNWINAASLLSIYDNLVDEMVLCSAAIADLKRDGIVDEAGFVGVLEELMLENAGLNWKTFFDMIAFRLSNDSKFETYLDGPSYKPPRKYEADIVGSVCSKWTQLEQAKYLPHVATLVNRIEELLR